MRRAVAVFALLLLPTFAFAEETRRYVVALKPAFSADRAAALLRDVEIAPQSREVAAFKTLDAFAADLTDAEARELRRQPNVRYVEEAVEMRAYGDVKRSALDASRNLAGQTVPAGIDIVRARDVWGVTKGETVNVVVMDTGITYTHPELAAAYAGGLNTYTQSGDPMDDHSHGTHVAGTIAAADNDIGVVGVAPGVRLWGVKVLKADGTGQTDRSVAGIDWVIQQKRARGGNWIINMSFGASVETASQREAVARAVNEGILIVAASGNESTAATAAPVSYPAAFPGVFAVGAIDNQLHIANFSNQGPQLSGVAPGVDVLSTVRLGDGLLSGISTPTGDLFGAALAGSKQGIVSGAFVFCGIGREGDFPAQVNGRIAVIQRGGEIKFWLKTRRAKEAGATAVVIVNHEDTPLSFTLIDAEEPSTSTYDWPVTVAISRVDGEQLLSQSNAMITVMNDDDDYDSYQGTSMASPHVAGIAALAWSVAPTATAADVKQALTATATDLGSSSFDNIFGFGLINALEAAKRMNPGAFGLPTTPPPASTRRRIVPR
ncbi:MAG TPA: S8 family serine peptidase [Thermoanaerobaculia bacterium]